MAASCTTVDPVLVVQSTFLHWRFPRHRFGSEPATTSEPSFDGESCAGKEADASESTIDDGYSSTSSQSEQRPLECSCPPGAKGARTTLLRVLAKAQSYRTTLMLRYVPKTLTREGLLQSLRAANLATAVNFLYLPRDHKCGIGFGFAFVNATEHSAALRLMDHFEGRVDWGSHASERPCVAVWSKPLQGLSANVERYRNSPVMREEVPEDFRPAVLEGGRVAAFPPPTRELKSAPRGYRVTSRTKKALAAAAQPER
jgi:hypothetical protein